MPLYRVFGTKYTNYYTIVSAADEYQAAEIANLRPETCLLYTSDAADE